MRLVPIALCLAFAGCAPIDMSGVPEPGAIGRDDIHFQSVASGTNADLHGVWGSGTDDVWVVGDDTLLRWRGGGLQAVGLAPRADGSRMQPAAIAGSGPDAIWMVGSARYFEQSRPVMRFDGQAWVTADEPWFTYGIGLAAWVSAAGDVWTAGAYGDVWHWDGRGWSDRTDPWPTNVFFRGAMYGIWASSPTDVWAVGDAPQASPRDVIARWDGGRWTYDEIPGRMTAIWGAGPDDIWVVGWEGAAAHWNGRFWSRFETGTGQTLRAVGGAGSDAVWAVGDGGTIRYWDGMAWGAVESGVEADLHGIWVGDDTWVVGASGTVLRYTP